MLSEVASEVVASETATSERKALGIPVLESMVLDAVGRHDIEKHGGIGKHGIRVGRSIGKARRQITLLYK